jgi:hypothetical protein
MAISLSLNANSKMFAVLVITFVFNLKNQIAFVLNSMPVAAPRPIRP